MWMLLLVIVVWVVASAALAALLAAVFRADRSVEPEDVPVDEYGTVVPLPRADTEQGARAG